MRRWLAKSSACVDSDGEPVSRIDNDCVAYAVVHNLLV